MQLIAQWSGGVVFGLPALLVLLAFCIVLAFLCFRDVKKDPYSDGIIFGVVFGICAIALAIGMVIGYWPLKGEYHQWNNKSGLVQSVSSRVKNTDETVIRDYVVLYADGTRLNCDDRRCGLVEPGDRLTLTCKRKWNYAGSDAWECKWVEEQDSFSP